MKRKEGRGSEACGVCTSSLERDEEFKKFQFMPPVVDTSILQHRPSSTSPTAGPPLAAFQWLSEERREDDVGGLPATPRSALVSIPTRCWRLGQSTGIQNFTAGAPPFCSIIAQQLTDPLPTRSVGSDRERTFSHRGVKEASARGPTWTACARLRDGVVETTAR